MNKQRMIVLGLAVVAAGGAAFLARGLLGGGTSGSSAAVSQQAVQTSEVLVASQALQPGDALLADKVRWEEWPSATIDPVLIKKEGVPDLNAFLKGAVVRSPLVIGEPVTSEKIARSDSANFMSATIAPGMRAVAIPVTIATVAGGFIQANDRVDIILTRKFSSTNVRSTTIVTDVRVLAIDQAAKDESDKEPVSDAKTATLELNPLQAEAVARASTQGTLSLGLRSLDENLPLSQRNGSTTGTPTREQIQAEQARLMAQYQGSLGSPSDGDPGAQVKIIRYGIVDPNTGSENGREN